MVFLDIKVLVKDRTKQNYFKNYSKFKRYLPLPSSCMIDISVDSVNEWICANTDISIEIDITLRRLIAERRSAAILGSTTDAKISLKSK